MAVWPFTIHVPDDALDDVRWRLGQTRFPEAMPGSGWDYGSNLEYRKALVHSWRMDFDWRAQEAQRNRWGFVRHNERSSCPLGEPYHVHMVDSVPDFISY